MIREKDGNNYCINNLYTKTDWNKSEQLLYSSTKMNGFHEFERHIMAPRFSRTDLDTSQCYIKLHRVDNLQVETYVGKFVRAFRMGSGDGMTSHWEFNNNGTSVYEVDDTWGSIAGTELIGFRKVD